jgi:hypothetical protein
MGQLLLTFTGMLSRRHAGLRGAFVIVAAIVSILGISVVCHAEEAFPDRFMLRVGGYNVQNADTVLRLDSNNLPIGTYVDFDETLGGDSRATVLRVDGLFRFNQHNGLGFSWYDLKFSGSTVLSHEINWGDITYPINAATQSELKFDVYKLSYRYSVVNDDEVELGAAIGLHVMRVGANIYAIASNFSQAQGEAVTAPLPVFGLYARYNFTPRFSTFYDYEAFFINYQDKFRGGLQDFLFGLEYRLFRHFSLGVAYNRFALNAKVKEESRTLYVDTNWNGGMLYGALYF